MTPTFQPRRFHVLLLLAALLAGALESAPAADAPARLKVLVVTGGHGFQREFFFQMFAANPDITFTEAKQSKASSDAYDREDLLTYDTVVLYDMVQHITDAQKARFRALFERGIGLVVLHHALVSYQDWPEFEHVIGGRYAEPQDKKGVVTPELGYQHDVDIPVVIAARGHPVTAGLKDFPLHDEIYWGFRVRPDVTPLLTTTHPKSGKPLAWARTEGGSRVVFIQPGHGARAFADANYRTLLAQSIRWTAKEDFARWRWSRTIQLNTSPSGANVTGDVKSFPVAVALNAANFDFSQAKPDGADLRFTGEPDAAPLPHSIEHWDAVAKSALVWVKVPVVRGNSTTQRIFLHWGNADATSRADSTVVFDTRNGFVGAWHLGDGGGTAEGGFRDSTANAAHGTGVNLQPGARADGPVGRALSLRHAELQWVKVDGEKRKLFDLTNSLTFSIWAKAHSYANKGDPAKRALPGYETMFAKGDNSWRLQKFGVRGWHKPPAELIEICVEKAPRGDLCVVGRTDMVTNEWFHFVGVHEHPQARLYVNGVLDKAETFDTPWKSDDHAVGIGNQSQFPQQGRAWDGVLDEARVLAVVKDAHWIKLDFESQRSGQKFLTFGEARKRF